MVRWFCSSALCFNNHNSLDDKGKPIKFYRLPRNPQVQAEYRKILKTSGFNWRNGHICAEHWKNGVRKDTNDLPNVAVPSSQVDRHRIKYENALKAVNAATNASTKQRETLKKVKRKFELVMRIAGSASDNTKSERRILPGRCNGEGAFAPATNLKCCENDVHQTAQQHEKEAQVIVKLEEEIKDLKDSLKVTIEEKNHLEIRNQELLSIINNLQEKEFTYINLMKSPKNFSYLTGLTIEQFTLIMACVEPYIHLIPYPHSKGSGQRSLDTKTELVTVWQYVDIHCILV